MAYQPISPEAGGVESRVQSLTPFFGSDFLGIHCLWGQLSVFGSPRSFALWHPFAHVHQSLPHVCTPKQLDLINGLERAFPSLCGQYMMGSTYVAAPPDFPITGKYKTLYSQAENYLVTWPASPLTFYIWENTNP